MYTIPLSVYVRLSTIVWLFSNTQINVKHMAQIVSNLFRRNQVCYYIFSILPNIFNICTSNFCQTFLLLFSAVPNKSTIGFWKITWGEISQNLNFCSPYYIQGTQGDVCLNQLTPRFKLQSIRFVDVFCKMVFYYQLFLSLRLLTTSYK